MHATFKLLILGKLNFEVFQNKYYVQNNLYLYILW